MLYPKICPPIFLKTFQERSSSCSRKSKGWPNKLPPKAVYLKIRVSCCIKIFESKGSQILTIVLIFFQDHPCQVSSLAEEVCSVNCSKAWKSTMLGQKSNVAHIQSNFKIFGQHLILKPQTSFDQGLIMIYQGFLTIHQEPKVAKLRFCRKSQLNFDQA